MPLPTTIISAAGIGGHQPPCKSSGGALYAVVRASNTAIACYKATDPSASWTEQNSAGRPAAFSNVTVLSYRQAGDVLHIATYSAGNYRYHTFNMATDAWGIVDELIETPAESPTFPWISLSVRNDGDVIVAYAGGIDKIKGSNKERVDYARREGGVWTAGIALDAAGDIHYGNPNVVKGPLTDDMHFVWQTTASTANPPTAWTDTEARTLDPANALSTTVTNTGDTSDTLLGASNLVSYESSGTQRIAWIGALGTSAINAWRATENASDDIQAPTLATATSYKPFVNGEVGVLTLAQEAGVLYALFSGGTVINTAKDIFYLSSSDHGAVWTTPLLELTISCNYISANIYQRGSSIVLAYAYDDGGVQKYNEKILTGISYTQLDQATMTSLVNSYVGPFEI